MAHGLDAPVIRGDAPGPPPNFTDFERELHPQVAGGLLPAPPVGVDREVRDGDVLDFGGGARVRGGSELEAGLAADARELVRLLYQDHLDLRTVRETRRDDVADAEGRRRGPTPRADAEGRRRGPTARPTARADGEADGEGHRGAIVEPGHVRGPATVFGPVEVTARPSAAAGSTACIPPTRP